MKLIMENWKRFLKEVTITGTDDGEAISFDDPEVVQSLITPPAGHNVAGSESYWSIENFIGQLNHGLLRRRLDAGFGSKRALRADGSSDDLPVFLHKGNPEAIEMLIAVGRKNDINFEIN